MSKALAIGAAVLSVISLVVVLSRGDGGGGQAQVAPAAAERAAKPEIGADDARLSAMEMELTRLIRRVDALERASSPRPGEPAPAMTADQQARQLASLRSDVDALLTGEPMHTEQGRERLKEVVRSLQGEMFADRVAQREQERSARLKKLIDDARLSGTQAQDLTRLLDDESQKRQAMMESMRSGGDLTPSAMRDQLRSLRQQTDDSAKSLLSADQFTQYQQMRSEDRGGGGGGARNLGPRGPGREVQTP